MAEKWTADVRWNLLPNLAESPTWEHRGVGHLWWVDIGNEEDRMGFLHRYTPSKELHESWCLNTMNKEIRHVGTLGLCEQSPNLIFLATDNGVWSFEVQDNSPPKVTRILDPESSLHGKTRFNDGKADPDGGFVIGSMAYSGKDPIGSLYRLTTDHGSWNCVKLLGKLAISNGLCWSMDKRTFYHINTSERQIRSYEWDSLLATRQEDSDPSVSSRVVYDFKACSKELPWSGKFPDGMTMDRDGNLWVAVFLGGCVVRIDPSKQEVTGYVETPGAKCPTCPVFGDGDLGTLYITTIRVEDKGVSEGTSRNAGAMFSIRIPGVGGHPSHLISL